MDARRIVVLPALGIGDAVFAVPALRALAARFPSAEISVLGSPWLRALLGPPRGPAHHVVALPDAARAWLRHGEAWDGAELQAFLGELASQRFDLAVQLFGGGRTSNPFVRAIGADWAIGLRAADAPPLDRTIPYRYWQSEVARHLEVVGLVGAATVDLDPSVDVLDGDRDAARAVLDGTRLDGSGVDRINGRGERQLALLIPGAGDGRRRWPSGSFAQLADRLDATGLDVAVIGGREDGPIARAIAVRASGRILDLTGQTSMSALIGLASFAAVAVGNDTGPTHVAAAVGAPTVAIFWCGNVINAGRSSRERYRPVLSWRIDCPVCGTSCIAGTCSHDASFVADIATDEVATEVRDLVEQGPAVSLPRARGCRAGRSCCRRRSGDAPGRGRPARAPGRSRASPPS